MQTVVISDVHIGTNYKTCWYQQSFHEPYIIALLDYILQNANKGTNPVNRLVILGDLFDFWTYPPSMDPPTIDKILAANPNLFGPNGRFTQVVQALNGNVQYIHGNHDILLTQADLNKIPGGGHQIQLLPDIYPDASGIVFTHGHLATMFNAPDARYPGQVPVGHFVTRALSYKLDTTLPPGKTAADLPSFGAPDGAGMWKAISLNGQFENPSITNVLLDSIAKYCGFDINAPIQMGKGQAPTTISAAKTKYDGLFMQWVAQNGDAGLIIAAKSAQADFDGSYMAWFAQQFAFRNNAKGIVMGHTHIPKVGIKESWCQYVNNGFECPPIPDIKDGKNTWNFTMIAQDGAMQLMQVVNRGGSYQIQPDTSAPPDQVVYAPSLDYSCYVKINNNSPIAALDASGDPAGYVRSDKINSVVYRGTNNHIYELWLRDGVWHHVDLSGGIGAPAASGNPAGYARSDGTNSVVYRGTNNHIYELFLEKSRNWQYGDLSAKTGAPEASGDPAGYARSDGTNSVVYRGTKNHVYELFLEKNRDWQYGDLSAKTGAPEASGDPAGYARSDGTNSVVYRGTKNHVYELFLEKNRDWQYGDLSAKTGAPEASGDPAGYARSDGINAVVYRGTKNHIYELFLEKNRDWQYGDLSANSGAPDASGDPTGYARSDGINAVVYRGTKNHIYELFLEKNRDWQYGDLSANSGAPEASGDPAGYVRSDKINAVVYRGTKHIYELSLLDGVWHSSDLAGGTDLVRQTLEATHGYYATEPPARIPANQTGEFWIQDFPGVRGSEGTATYISSGTPFAFSFSCPTPPFPNTARGGAALLASSENPPSPNGPYNNVPFSGYPLFVEFFIQNPAPAQPKAWTPTSMLAKAVDFAGFDYDPGQDIIYSKMYPLQRNFGYAYGYDAAALLMSAVIDCEPIFFDYAGKTWMIELWKGQYGLETGCEIGVYTRAIGSKGPLYFVLDNTVGVRPYDKTAEHNQYFDCAADSDLLVMSSTLYRNGQKLFSRGPEPHWWLTGFKWGVFSNPEDLTMDVSITCKDSVMATAFVTSLRTLGYQNVSVSANTVSFTFAAPYAPQPRAGKPDLVRTIQAQNAAIVKSYDGLGLSSNDPNTITDDANATMILNSVSIYASAFFSQVVADLAKKIGIDAAELLSTLAQKFSEAAAAASNFLTQAGYSFPSWINSFEKVLGINLDFSCIIEFVNSGPYTLKLTKSEIIYGGYVIPPPPTIGPQQTIRFWLKDPKPSIHGAQGRVSYTYTDSNNQTHAVTFNYDCPTSFPPGLVPNAVSITPGSPFNFYAQSGKNYSPAGWGRLNSVPRGDHPLYVAFIWGTNPPPA